MPATTLPDGSPQTAYHDALCSKNFEPDAAQAEAVDALTRLYQALMDWRPPSPSLASRLLRRHRRAATQVPVRGLYLWGGVGRGKTWLMDLFCDALPITEKHRVHFHRFMQSVHADLARLKGRQDPLRQVAAETAARCRVLCLDEMQVNDITDAMIMGGLLEALFEHGVTLVTTSNIPPEGLYRSGIQRDRFKPAIVLMQRHCQVLELASPTDYRLRRLEQASVYVTPLNSDADRSLAAYFEDITTAEHRRQEPIVVNDRDIPTVAWGDGVVWLDFDVICQIPRSKLDYVELARLFHTLLLSNVRCLDDERSNIAHRLITLIDAIYDCNVNLMLTAEAPPVELYAGRDLAFEFQRTASRLIEMQSHDYLAKPHLA
ncbi:MAG: cell division protein ZapE [Thiohalocapsa sp.]